MMKHMRLASCLILTIAIIMTIMTFVRASTVGGKLQFQHPSEMVEFNIDERPGNHRGHRNHRGRGVGHNRHITVPEFEQGLPVNYPIRGPPQAPLILPPGRDLGLENNQFATSQDNRSRQQLQQQQSSNNLPAATQQLQQNHYNPYASNPFLSKFPTSDIIPTNKQNSQATHGITNQLPTTDKITTTTTTTPSYANPRRTDLLYGSNLLEEETQPEAKSSDTIEISFSDRGLFDTAPHCQSGHILVNNRCRLAV